VLGLVLLRASRSESLRRTVERSAMTGKVVDRFVAGADVSRAIAATADLHAAGRTTTIDFLGEDVSDHTMARAVRDEYLRLLDALTASGEAQLAEVSVKLSAVGQGLDGGHDLALRHAREICAAADAAGCRVTLDMEDHTTVDSTLAIGDELRTEYQWVGNVLQANLHRTAADIAALSARGVRIRIVKGAYREPSSVAFQRKADVDKAYEQAIDALMRSSCYPMVATHHPEMLEHACRTAERAGRAATEWEAQMLYGIRADLQSRLARDGHQVRVYIPYGSDWYGYFMRRLAERPANVAFFLRALTRR
jgi:proline dehydrogenase